MEGLVYLGILLALYILPTIVGYNRKVPNVGSIAAINGFLGWTLIGWVVALAMALRTVPPTLTPGNALAAGASTATPLAIGRGQTLKRCPDCAELVQPEARICRFCKFNFDTGIGADGEVRQVETPLKKEVAPPPRPFALEQAWTQLGAGHTKFALDQAFVALQGADHPAVLADLAAFAAAVSERNPQGVQHARAEALTKQIEQQQAAIGAT